MRLNILKFKDQEEEWELDELKFWDLTLLKHFGNESNVIGPGYWKRWKKN